MKDSKQLPFWVSSLIVILVFTLSLFGHSLVSRWIVIDFPNEFSRILYKLLWWIIFPSMAAGLLFGFRELFHVLGLSKGFLTGLVFAAVSVVPMMTGSAFTGPWAGFGWESLGRPTLIAGFTEEFLFRGFLFGILFSRLRWGFLPASLVGAVVFGAGHLYQGNSMADYTGIFIATFMGAIWFCWLFAEWENNLWVPVFLHTFMNLSWELFEVSPNAGGTLLSNLFRALTIALSIFLTIRHKHKTSWKVSRRNLLRNPANNL